MNGEASFSAILREMFSLVAQTWRDIALFTIVIGALTTFGVVTGLGEAVSDSLNFRFGFVVDASDSPASGLFDVVMAIASVVATYWLLTRYLAALGHRTRGRKGFLPYLGMAIPSSVAIVFGFLLLIVPGVILLVRWSAAAGFLIGGGKTVTGALAASWRATKGHGWAIFFAALALALGMTILAWVIGAILRAVGSPGSAGALLADLGPAFVQSAANAVFAGFGIAVYRLVDQQGDLGEVFA